MDSDSSSDGEVDSVVLHNDSEKPREWHMPS